MANITQANHDIDAIRKAAQEDIRDLRARISALDQDSLDLILTRARSHYAWSDVPVTDAQIARM